MTDKIICRAIVEIVGKPKEHVEKAIKAVIEAAKGIDGLKVLKEDIAETKSLKDEKLSKTEDKIQKAAGGELFSTFVEIEFSASTIDIVSSFCFDFLPSSLEIIEPEELQIKNRHMTKTMNDILAKIHNADMAVKRLNFENAALRSNATLLLRNMIIISLKSKEKNLEELSKATGIPSEQLKPFVDSLIENKFLKEEKGIYKSSN